MKKMKKPNPAFFQHLALGLIIFIFLYWFYYLYINYRDYQAERKNQPAPGTTGTAGTTEVPANPNGDDALPVTPPSFYIIPPGGNGTSDIFSFNEKKNESSDQSGGEINKPSDYTILGVVKRDRLYLAVRMPTDNKLRLLAEGDAINENARIKKLELFSVVVVDSQGMNRTYKIFQWQDIKELRKDEKKKKEPEQ